MEVVGGRYEIVRSLAGGGMGSVHEALDRVVGRRVALKTLHPHLAGEPSLCERFRREALAAAALAHPHIAQASDYGVDPTHGPFLVMELLVGEALSERLARDGAFAPDRAVFVAAQALDALEAAHAAGIVHRDIKPSNVFLTQLAGVADVVKVIDFGIAKLHESQTWQRLTATGQIIGTPTYMAPEQALGRPIDARVDVYAIGLVLYAMLTGRPAFRPGGPETIVPILEGRYVPLRELAPHVDPALAAVVARAMAVDREARFPSASAMREALGPWLPSNVGSLHAVRSPSPVAAPLPSAPSPSATPSVAPPQATRVARPAAAPSDTTPRTSSRRTLALVVAGATLGALLFVGAFVAWRAQSRAEPTMPSFAIPAQSEAPSEIVRAPAEERPAKPPTDGVAPARPPEEEPREEAPREEAPREEALREEAPSEEAPSEEASPERESPPAEARSRRPVARSNRAEPGVCEDTCRWAHDDECDDGRPGSHTSTCPRGTDCSDCGTWTEGARFARQGTAVRVENPARATNDSCDLGFRAFDAAPFGNSHVRTRIFDRNPGPCLTQAALRAATLTLTTSQSGEVVDVQVSPARATLRPCLLQHFRALRFEPPAATTFEVPLTCH